ncbi:hypothetical protein EB796_003419 [Bugula neritina]|uniref:Uncharacterized protein n=1 Tax=Bugula neritina TaxID=10212 RepID=A0A7J7KKT2_BUGNE|nr:hypothetical protein EB796_003419 [Bugula neritina]
MARAAIYPLLVIVSLVAVSYCQDDSSSCTLEPRSDGSPGDPASSTGPCTAQVAQSSDVSRQIESMRAVLTGSDTADGREPSSVDTSARSRPISLLPVSPLAPWCPTTTAFNQPSAVWISGQLWGVVQTSFFRQGHNERICRTTECRGRAAQTRRSRRCPRPRPVFWRGACVQKYVWVRLLVYRGTTLRWRYVRFRSDCCCTPYRINSLPIAGPILG